jgi:hypothetical protein
MIEIPTAVTVIAVLIAVGILVTVVRKNRKSGNSTGGKDSNKDKL